MSEQEYMDFRSKYLDITVGVVDKDDARTVTLEEPEIPYGDSKLEDIDFCLELLHSDVINVAYILALIEDLNPENEDRCTCPTTAILAAVWYAWLSFVRNCGTNLAASPSRHSDYLAKKSTLLSCQTRKC